MKNLLIDNTNNLYKRDQSSNRDFVVTVYRYLQNSEYIYFCEYIICMADILDRAADHQKLFLLTKHFISCFWANANREDAYQAPVLRAYITYSIFSDKKFPP